MFPNRVVRVAKMSVLYHVTAVTSYSYCRAVVSYHRVFSPVYVKAVRHRGIAPCGRCTVKGIAPSGGLFAP